jgi:hypothetical protein
VSPLKLLVRLTIVAAALFAAVVHVAPAAAATPCWKSLLNDWYDGRIDQTYPVRCYNDALKHLPADVRTYSSAHDDILRALQSAIAHQRALGHKVGPNTKIAPPTTSKPGKRGTTTTTTVGRQPDKGLGGVADRLNPSSASSPPVPLLVLGGLAILLVAAGAAGLIFKRLQARKPGH